MQGLDWYTKGLKEDSDGDVASEFLEEPSTPSRRVQQSSANADTPPSLKVCSIPSQQCSKVALTVACDNSSAQSLQDSLRRHAVEQKESQALVQAQGPHQTGGAHA